MGTADLYGSNDPYQRMPRSPRLLPASPSDDVIVKVDLSNYSQVTKSKVLNLDIWNLLGNMFFMQK